MKTSATRDRIALLEKTIEGEKKKQRAVFNKEWRLKHELKLAKQLVVQEEGLIRRRPWSVVYNPENQQFRLCGGEAEHYPELAKLLDDGHGRFGVELERGVELSLYDGRLWLNFQKAANAEYFIRTWELAVSADGLDDAIRAEEDKVNTRRTVRDTVKRILKEAE